MDYDGPQRGAALLHTQFLPQQQQPDSPVEPVSLLGTMLSIMARFLLLLRLLLPLCSSPSSFACPPLVVLASFRHAAAIPFTGSSSGNIIITHR